MAFDHAYLKRILAESERIDEIIARTYVTIARSKKLLSGSEPSLFLGPQRRQQVGEQPPVKK